MARRGWRYIAQRLTGDGAGEFLDWDLPLSGVEIEDVLSGHNALSATITPAVARLMADDGLPVLDDWTTAIYAENDGDIRGGGIVTDVSYDGPDLKLGCIGFTGYSQDMPYTGEGWFGVEIDPLDVFRYIWDHIQSQPGGNIGLEIPNLKTGLKIGTELHQVQFDTESGPVSFEAGPYKLAFYQDHDLSDNIDKLAADTPFDFHEQHFWDGDTIRHALTLGYPQIGKKQDNLRLVFGENIFELPTVDRAGEDYATEALVLGAGEGAKMKRGSAYRPRKGLRRVAVVSDSSLRSNKAVDSRAAAELQWRRELDTISEIRVVDTPHAPLGSIGVGDTVILSGRASEWRTVDTQVRVLQRKIEPEKGNEAVYTVARTDKLVS